MDKEKVNKVGYKIGYLFGTIIFACLSVAIIAATIKFVMWLF